MRTNLLFAAVVMSLVCLGSAWPWQEACPDFTTQEDFDLQQYLGDWQEAARLKTIPFESGDCVYARYTLRDDGKVKVNNTEILPNGKINTAIGKAYQTDIPSRLKVSFFLWFYGDYNVIETNYADYSVIYSCQRGFFLPRQEFAWILTRPGQGEVDISDRLETLKGLGVDESELFIHDLNQCPESV